MTRTSLLAVLLSCALLPAVASAAEPFTDPIVAASFAIAQEQFGATAPCPQISVHVTEERPGIDATALGCEILLDRPWLEATADRPFERCAVLVHEYGHLLGFGHSADGSIMDPAAPIDGAPRCAELASAPVVDAAELVPTVVRAARRPRRAVRRKHRCTSRARTCARRARRG